MFIKINIYKAVLYYFHIAKSLLDSPVGIINLNHKFLVRFTVFGINSFLWSGLMFKQKVTG